MDFSRILIGWFIKLSVQTFQSQIVIYRGDNYVYHNLECTLIYRPLSYPIRTLCFTCKSKCIFFSFYLNILASFFTGDLLPPIYKNIQLEIFLNPILKENVYFITQNYISNKINSLSNASLSEVNQANLAWY